MDPTRFDVLTKALIRGTSRRRVLQGLGGGLAGLLGLGGAAGPPVGAQRATPVPGAERVLYTVPLALVPADLGRSVGFRLWRGHYPIATPVPVLGGPGATILVYVAAGTMTAAPRPPAGWADPAADYRPRTVAAGAAVALPPANAAVLQSQGASAEAIVLIVWVPTTIPQPPGGNPEASAAGALFERAIAAGYRETTILAGDFSTFPTGAVSIELAEVTVAPGVALPAGGAGTAEAAGVTRGLATLTLRQGRADQVWPVGQPGLGPRRPAAGDVMTLWPGGFYLLPPGSAGELRTASAAPAVLLRVRGAPAPSATPTA